MHIWLAALFKVLRVRIGEHVCQGLGAAETSSIAAAAMLGAQSVAGAGAGEHGRRNAGTRARARARAGLRVRARVGAFEIVREGHVARGLEAGDVGAVFILDTEDGPHAATSDFHKGDEERGECGAGVVGCKDAIDDPAEAQHGIQHQGKIVGPGGLEAAYRTQERLLGVGLEQGPVHDQIPDRDVDAVENTEEVEDNKVRLGALDAVETERHVVRNRHEVLAAVDKMRKLVARVVVSSKTLQCTPDARYTRHEAHGP